ncbi:C-type lectin domain-containing protein 88-like, partial [Sardina pilchardus]|uniref:C-type lectin domain-containing protein 88-like n=1 Tax=Sardina pilchardus TaxID=27697 RepID=UPI002E1139BE
MHVKSGVMESVPDDRFSSSDTEKLHHDPKLVPLKGRQTGVAYVLYGLLILLLLILLMVTGSKFSQLSQGVEEIKIYLSVASHNSPIPTKSTQYARGCHDGWSHFEDHCYYMSTEKTNWNSAQQRCIEQQGYLFVPNTLMEMAYMTELAIDGEKYWIGMVEYGYG